MKSGNKLKLYRKEIIITQTFCVINIFLRKWRNIDGAIYFQIGKPYFQKKYLFLVVIFRNKDKIV